MQNFDFLKNNSDWIEIQKIAHSIVKARNEYAKYIDKILLNFTKNPNILNDFKTIQKNFDIAQSERYEKLKKHSEKLIKDLRAYSYKLSMFLIDAEMKKVLYFWKIRKAKKNKDKIEDICSILNRIVMDKCSFTDIIQLAYNIDYEDSYKQYYEDYFHNLQKTK